MVAFRQVIFPGDVGADVLAVKHALRRMGIKGSGAMNSTRRAGEAFVAALEVAQRRGSIKVDGKYGKDSHKFISPHFTAKDAELYKSAVIREQKQPPAPKGDAAANAKRLVKFHAQGKYRADSAGDLEDIRATAEGKAVRSRSGKFVHIDPRVMRVLVHLIESGHTIGTSAICSDHHDDGEHGHAGGFAVDISSIDGQSLASGSARTVALKIDKALHDAGVLLPRQLITGGVGQVLDNEFELLTIPNASFFGLKTMRDHTNHIHVGY
jgi:hypothetical protein